MMDGIASSYRTYEEWKLPSINLYFVQWSSSYRTYEEWKLIFRNLLNNLIHKFLPYLWGMETFLWFPQVLDLVGSYRTYEEWKRN